MFRADVPHVSYLLPSIRGLQAAGFQSTRCQIFVLSTYLDPTMSPWIRQVVLLVATYWLACPMRGPTTRCVHSCALIWFMLYCHAVLPSFVTTLRRGNVHARMHATQYPLHLCPPPRLARLSFTTNFIHFLLVSATWPWRRSLAKSANTPWLVRPVRMLWPVSLGQERQIAIVGITLAGCSGMDAWPRAP